MDIAAGATEGSEGVVADSGAAGESAGTELDKGWLRSAMSGTEASGERGCRGEEGINWSLEGLDRCLDK